jgi:pimeloyl-ACP methyl ester carboxylesterase
MPTAVIDGIVTGYEVVSSGPPLLMYAPGGFNAVVEAWSTLGVYQKIKLLDHLPAHFTCILFDRRECGQSGGRVEPITWSHYVAQGKGLLEHLHISRAHLMGGCMGCAPVAAFAARRPATWKNACRNRPIGTPPSKRRPKRRPTRACSNFCAACSYDESMGAYALGRDVSRSIIAVIRTIVLRLFAGRTFGGALSFGRASPVAQANDVIGIGGLCVRDRFGHDSA